MHKEPYTSNPIEQVQENESQKREIERCFKSDLVIQTAVGFLYTMLMSKGGISFQEIKNSKPQTEFNSYLKQILNPLVHPFLHDLLCFGRVAYVINIGKRRQFGKRVKYISIVPSRYYTVQMTTHPDCTVDYEAITNSNFKINKKIYLFIQPGYGPNPENGLMRSIMSPCVSSIRFISKMQELYVDAVTQRSHPPILLVKKDDTNRVADEMALQSGDVEEKIFKRNKAKTQYQAQQYYRDQMDDFSRMKRMRPEESSITNEYGGAKIYYSTPIDNVHRVPFGFEVSGTQAPMPEPVDEIHKLEQAHSEKMLALLRIPVSLVLSIQRNRTDVTQRIDDSDYILMHRTIIDWKTIILDFMNEAYSLMYPSHRQYAPEVSFVLPTIPFINSTSLYQLYNQNIIDLDVLKGKLIDINNLDEADIAKGPNNIIRPPVGGSYNDTTPMINATVKNLNAQSKSVVENIDISQQMADTAKIAAKKQDSIKKQKTS